LLGNIGSLLKQEQNGNYAMCGNNVSIGGGPNCTGVFNKDNYTTSNTCGEKCNIGVPEAFGGNPFGMEDDPYTNAHGLHAYINKRAAVEGKGPSNKIGCYEWVPNLVPSQGNSCELNYKPFEAMTVGDLTKLPSWQNFAKYSYSQ
jgi:hypothetical protein